MPGIGQFPGGQENLANFGRSAKKNGREGGYVNLCEILVQNHHRSGGGGGFLLPSPVGDEAFRK